MKRLIVIVIVVINLAACSNVKKVQVIQDALAKKDSSSFVVPVIDSMTIVQNIVDSIQRNKIHFETLNAKFKLDYESEKNADSYVANLSMKKDSAMFITIRGAMGVIGLKALIRKDSVILIYPLTKKIDRKPLMALYDIIKIPFSYQTMEDLVVGNPIFLDSAKLNAFNKTEDKLQISLLGTLFKNLVVLNEDHTKLLHLKLDDVDLIQHRTCVISYDNHVLVGATNFPLNREITIGGKSKLEIRMEVKEYGFDEPLKYTFTIPRPGKRR